MRKLILTYCFLLAAMASSSAQSAVINDNALKQCFLDNYPNFLNPDSTLNTDSSNAFTGAVACSGYNIQNVKTFQHFTKAYMIDLGGINVDSIHTFLSLDKLRILRLNDSNLGTLPDLSGMKLQEFNASNCGLTSFPSFNDSIHYINLSDNNISSVTGLGIYSQLKNLSLTSNGMDTIAGYENLQNVRFLFLGGNNLDTIPSVANLDSLERIHIYGNNITGVAGMENKPIFWNLNAVSNRFSTMPTFGSSPMTSIKLAWNRLTFEDFLPITGLPGFPSDYDSYHLQQYRGPVGDTIVVNESDSWSWDLDFDLGVNSNYYLWYLDSVLYDSTTDGSLILDVVTPDHDGTWSCFAKNTILDTMTIIVHPVELEVISFPGHVEPVAFSPDGDGDNDELYIQDPGETKIYNERGKLVRQLISPARWDGRSDTGELLSLGYYLIFVEGQPKIKATLVR